MRFYDGPLDGHRYIQAGDSWIWAGGPGMNYVIVDNQTCHCIPKSATEWTIWVPTIMGPMKIELSYDLKTEMFTAATSSGKEGKGHEPQQAVDMALDPITAEEAGHD